MRFSCVCDSGEEIVEVCDCEGELKSQTSHFLLKSMKRVQHFLVLGCPSHPTPPPSPHLVLLLPISVSPS